MSTTTEPATMSELNRQLARCLERLDGGSLARADLEAAISLAKGLGRGRQDLLFMQLCNTHPGSLALGMSMVIDGVAQEPPLNADQWPYSSVLDAIGDGWRVISFPNLALIVDGESTRSLGCEFILERWSAT